MATVATKGVWANLCAWWRRFNRRRRALDRQLHLVWQDVEWPVVVALALAAFVLGYIGFARNAVAQGQALTPWDLFYLSLQLFVLQSGAVPGPVGWELNLARLLAPAVAGYTAYQAIVAIFDQQKDLVRLWYWRNHAIICGLGRKGLLLAQGLRADDVNVVVIEPDCDNPRLAQCRDAGAIVLTGSDDEMLRKAHVERARYLFAVSGDDNRNAEIAVLAQRQLAGRPLKPLPTGRVARLCRTPVDLCHASPQWAARLPCACV
ncbi:MAG TPA: NAD-binding protein [Anaerolineae bacterium]|nr:NAD-binding protein [Anaerolineae bacterium]HOQ98619.1 NAD-binding protein [Anaerolineae bacterium]HPL27158.1 NAD-binding protein [Anaerolineae bacterium]